MKLAVLITLIFSCMCCAYSHANPLLSLTEQRDSAGPSISPNRGASGRKEQESNPWLTPEKVLVFVLVPAAGVFLFLYGDEGVKRFTNSFGAAATSLPDAANQTQVTVQPTSMADALVLGFDNFRKDPEVTSLVPEAEINQTMSNIAQYAPVQKELMKRVSLMPQTFRTIFMMHLTMGRSGRDVLRVVRPYPEGVPLHISPMQLELLVPELGRSKNLLISLMAIIKPNDMPFGDSLFQELVANNMLEGLARQFLFMNTRINRVSRNATEAAETVRFIREFFLKTEDREVLFLRMANNAVVQEAIKGVLDRNELIAIINAYISSEEYTNKLLEYLISDRRMINALLKHLFAAGVVAKFQELYPPVY